MPDLAPRAPTLRATARLQFHKDFTLDDATELVPYFAKLGISHLYASPLLTARPGSTHGYDIVDHNTINPELGGEPALIRLVDRLRGQNLGLILDIVPNHMGVGGADNAWWQDVLEWGRASPYASYFDIDWDRADTALKGRMLAPFLGQAYGLCLKNNELQLIFDQAEGRILLDYGGNHFPINPRDYPIVLRQGSAALQALATPFSALRGQTAREPLRAAAAAARQALGHAAALMPAALDRFSAATPEGAERLHRLLERQSYRLTWWRAAADEINWRRFFDVNSLAGIRAELPEVFDATHRTVFRLYAEGLIDGVRVDHVDGLADPRGYCRKLRRRLDAEASKRPPGLTPEPAIIWVEKILAHGERLPRDWLTDGTTGYDFMNDVSALFHDPAGEGPLTQLWTSLTGRPASFEAEAQTARRQILRESLSSELFATATALHRIARRSLDTRDYTLTGIRRVLAEVLAHFTAYRIYAGLGGSSAADDKVMDRAFAGARGCIRSADLPLLDQVREWLSGRDLRQIAAGPRRAERLRAMVRFQQLSAPTAAKSTEDTAFYRYGRLISRNEVGTEPSQFSLSPAAFHALCLGRRKHYPRALLATATHDHKRGEDHRARLAVLSECPAAWEAAIGRWMRLNAPLKREIDGVLAPDATDELMLYQAVIGAWPYGLAPADQAGLDAFIARLKGWQEKALREGKRRSEWAKPNDAYEAACQDFLTQMLQPGRAAQIAQDMAAFAHAIGPAGAVNALGQTLLRLTTPGVPDLYQGCEFWDFSLVDPDNRRPVDFAARIAALDQNATPAAMLPCWRDGRIKQALIARTLAYRAREPGLFAAGLYQKIAVEGPLADHCFAFARLRGVTGFIVLVTRLAAGCGPAPLLDANAWGETALILPRALHGRPLADLLGGVSPPPPAAERLPVAALLQNLPVALLELG